MNFKLDQSSIRLCKNEKLLLRLRRWYEKKKLAKSGIYHSTKESNYDFRLSRTMVLAGIISVVSYRQLDGFVLF